MTDGEEVIVVFKAWTCTPKGQKHVTLDDVLRLALKNDFQPASLYRTRHGARNFCPTGWAVRKVTVTVEQ